MPTRNIQTPPPPASLPVIAAEDTVTFKRSHFYSVLVVLAFSTGLILGYILWGHAAVQTAAVAQAAPPAALPTQVPVATPAPVKYDIPTEGFPSIGPANAPIVIVEFSDYQCPYCTQWHDKTYQPLLAAYPGKIRLVYRNYPLPFHQNAFKAAEAALCAGDQNAYWQYHDKLFANNDQLNNQAQTVLDNSFYVNLAGQLKLDTAAFETCLTTEKHKQDVQNDINYADSLPPDSSGQPPVSGTPTFFINGVPLVGAMPLAYFKQIIDAQLNPQ